MRHHAQRLPGPAPGRRHRDLRRAGDPTHVGAVRVDLHLPGCHSLKDKRAVIRPILDGARNRYRVATSEVGAHDAWQRAILGIAAVGATVGHVEEVLDEVERFVWSFPEIEVVSTDRTWLEATWPA